MDTEKITKKPSIWDFITIELTRSYALEYGEGQYSARREKVYSFFKIPFDVEKFMKYGFMQCADSFLFIYTFLPIRIILGTCNIIKKLLWLLFGYKPQKLFDSAEACDFLKLSIIIICSMGMSYVDLSVMYHLIKSQSIIKLYIFYNMLEVADKLFSTFGQDLIDTLFWTAAEPRHPNKYNIGVILLQLFCCIYVFLHSLLVLMQATILNVAMNSSSNGLLTIMMSNNFVELKGSVFKKFDKNNLYQVACSDVRERFHLLILLSIVVLLTMKEYAWAEDRFWNLVFYCSIVLFTEVGIDWLKHAFITRFNEIPLDVYKDFTYSLAYDVAQTRQKHAFTDHSDLVARRMGFIPLPLTVVITHVFRYVVTMEGIGSILIAVLAYVCMLAIRIAIIIYILGRACDLIDQHQTEKTQAANSEDVMCSQKPYIFLADVATTPTHPNVLRKRFTLVKKGRSADLMNDNNKDDAEKSAKSKLRSPEVFSDSSVNINDIVLNEEITGEIKSPTAEITLESIGETDNENMTRSEPNIQTDDLVVDETIDIIDQVNNCLQNLSVSDENGLSKKRAESEPSIPLAVSK